MRKHKGSGGTISFGRYKVRPLRRSPLRLQRTKHLAHLAQIQPLSRPTRHMLRGDTQSPSSSCASSRNGHKWLVKMKTKKKRRRLEKQQMKQTTNSHNSNRLNSRNAAIQQQQQQQHLIAYQTESRGRDGKSVGEEGEIKQQQQK